MPKVLVLYYSAYGHIETMANAVAEGAREAGASVDIKRVPELVPPDVAKASHYKVDQAAPVAKIDDLANYDAIIVGTAQTHIMIVMPGLDQGIHPYREVSLEDDGLPGQARQ